MAGLVHHVLHPTTRALSGLGGGQHATKGGTGAGQPLPPHQPQRLSRPLASDLQRPSGPPAEGGAPGTPAPRSPHLDPPHGILDGRGCGRHLLVHHSPELLLTHVQALRLQLLGGRGIRESGRVDGFRPGCPTEPGGQTGSALSPTCAPQWQALHLSPCSAQAGRRYGETGPRPHRPPPGPRSAARLTWPSWRMPCRGVRTRPGRACSRACCSCSCPMSSSARAPHSLQVSIRPGAGRGL